MLIDQIKKMRDEYYKASGKYPEKIQIHRDVLDRVNQELENEIGVVPEKLFGMKVEITGGDVNENEIHG